MKNRVIALFLILTVLIPSAALGAEDPDPDVPGKFLLQSKVSGVNGTFTFQVNGAESAAVDPMVWALLQSLAPRLSIQLKNSFVQTDREDQTQGYGQGSITLLLDGQTLGNVTSIYNQDDVAVSSDLLSASPVYYAASRAWEWTSLLQDSASPWPSLWQAIGRTENASPEWHEKVSTRLIPYETKVGIWLNGYAQYSTGNENGVPYIQMICHIPAQAVKAQMKQLLVDFYGDDELLSCLREVFTAQEAAAYLQPDMMQSLFTLIDLSELEGEVVIQRRYDLSGASLIDSITLPLPGEYPLTHLTIAHTPHEAGLCWTLSCQTREGLKAEISCVIGEENLYSGSVLLEIPKADADQNSYLVDDDYSPVNVIAFDYNFSWEPGEDIHSLLADRYDRACKATLLIRPREDMQMPAQSIMLDAAFATGLTKRSSATLKATLTWRDLESDASISAVFSGRTAAPGAVQQLEDTENLLRLDLIGTDVAEALKADWLVNLQSWLLQSAARLFPALTVQETEP